jgi:hypothetical protein
MLMCNISFNNSLRSSLAESMTCMSSQSIQCPSATICLYTLELSFYQFKTCCNQGNTILDLMSLSMGSLKLKLLAIVE